MGCGLYQVISKAKLPELALNIAVVVLGIGVTVLLALVLSHHPQSLVVGVPLFGFVIACTFLEVTSVPTLLNLSDGLYSSFN